MFAVGEYIIYGIEGVCRVDEIGHPKMQGLDRSREYYRLTPYYHGGTVYTPVDGRTVMRPVITKEELEKLISKAKGLPLLDDVPADSRQAAEYYKRILAEHDCEVLLRLCRTLQEKQKKLVAVRKNVSSTELRNWKAAEEMLVGEFGFVLGMKPSETKEFLQKEME